MTQCVHTRQSSYAWSILTISLSLHTPLQFSIGEARKIVERDWGRDVGDSDVMSKTLFFRSLFEVVRSLIARPLSSGCALL